MLWRSEQRNGCWKYRCQWHLKWLPLQGGFGHQEPVGAYEEMEFDWCQKDEVQADLLGWLVGWERIEEAVWLGLGDP